MKRCIIISFLTTGNVQRKHDDKNWDVNELTNWEKTEQLDTSNAYLWCLKIYN